MTTNMTGRLASMALAVALLLGLAGCPFPLPKPGEFLSANPAGGSRFNDFNSPAPTTGAEDDGAGEGETPRDVVEPDVIRQVDDTLYVLNQYRGLSIIDLESETLISQTPTPGYPRDLYLADERAYVLVASYSEVSYAADVVSVGSVGTRLYVLDIADPAAPVQLGAFDLDGDLVDSRLVGDVLYAVGAEYTYYYPENPGEPGVAEPGVVEGGVVKQQTSASWVSSIDLSNPAAARVVDQLSFAGYGDVIQATSSALFVAGHDWQSDTATITYVDIADPSGVIAVRGSVQVPGRVADRFKMDAWDGVLRVVSNTGWPTRQTYVTTIPLADPDALAVLGQTAIPSAENETLFATRFDGPVAYAVTYLVVDPLFVLDLSDPANPRVAGELKVPGWSTHIEPRGDRLIALGVDDANGGRRVSVSLFDVSNPEAPALLDRESFGEDWSWSSAYGDVKAFTVLDEVLIVPFSGWSAADGGFDRLQFVSHDANSLDTRGHVDLRGQAVRSFEHAGHYYGLTQEELAIIDGNDLDNPQVVGSITLAENVSDFLPLEVDGAAGVAVIRSYANNRIVLRAQDDEGAALSELELAGDYAGQVFGGASAAGVLSTVWDTERVHMVVQAVDYADPSAPVSHDPLRLNLRPAYTWGWWGYPGFRGGAEPAIDAGMVADVLPYPYYGAPNSVVAGDRLVVMGERADAPYETDAEKILAVVNLATGQLEGEVNLGRSFVNGLLSSGDGVVLSSQEDAGQNLLGQGFTRHFVQLFNPATRALGPRANVPGTPVQYASGLLLLEDWQYARSFEVERLLRSVRWDGGDAATLVDSADLGNSYGGLLASGGFVYSPQWENSFQVAAYAVADDGALSELKPLQPGGYASLLAADGGTLYLQRGGAALERHHNPGDWTLRDTTQLNQWPHAVRFGSTRAFVPLGYAGLLTLER